MPTIKKILLPVDFSERSIGAARYAEAVAGRFDAELMLLHVVTNGTNTLAEELEPRRRVQLESFLSDELKYIHTQRVCVVGDDPAARILETARNWQPDLLMMATHGLGFYRRLLLGSVAAKVLHDWDGPVWTDVHAESAPVLDKISVRKVLCAIDFDANVPCVLNWATFLAQEYGAQLALIHAIPAPEASVPVRYLDEEYTAALAADSRKRIEALLESVPVNNAKILIEPGKPAGAVSKVAREFGADLAVIGRHSKIGLAAHLHQNAYSIICESPCPVLSI